MSERTCKDDDWTEQKAIEEDGAFILAGRLELRCKYCGRQPFKLFDELQGAFITEHSWEGQ